MSVVMKIGEYCELIIGLAGHGGPKTTAIRVPTSHERMAKFLTSSSLSVKLLSGHSVPVVGFGVYEITGNSCKASVLEALKVGYRHIDTAQYYGNEREVGEAIRESGIPRSEIFVTTKVYRGFAEFAELSQNVDASLAELNIGYIDLFLIHSPLCGPELRISTWRHLSTIAAEDGGRGRVRSVGVSNLHLHSGVHHLQQLEAAGLSLPAVNQIELHPHLPQLPIVAHCAARGIVVQAYCPLMRGPSAQQSTGPGAWWSGKPEMGWANPRLRAIATKHERTVAQVLLRWSLQHGFVPVPKSASSSRMRENFDVFGFRLSDDDMMQLDKMDLTDGGKIKDKEGQRVALEWNPVECE